MVPLTLRKTRQHPRCESELGCVRQPTFGWEGEKARYCSAHKVEGMLDVKVRTELTPPLHVSFFFFLFSFLGVPGRERALSAVFLRVGPQHAWGGRRSRKQQSALWLQPTYRGLFLFFFLFLL